MFDEETKAIINKEERLVGSSFEIKYLFCFYRKKRKWEPDYKYLSYLYFLYINDHALIGFYKSNRVVEISFLWINFLFVRERFKYKMTYTARHVPSGETWVILGVNDDRDMVCAAGWPPSIGKISDCTNFKERGIRTDKEQEYMEKEFGLNWN